MQALTFMQREALLLAGEKGQLEHVGGGLWCPPGEVPEHVDLRVLVVRSERAAISQTVNVLVRRGHLKAAPPVDGPAHRETVVLTDLGRRRLEDPS